MNKLNKNRILTRAMLEGVVMSTRQESTGIPLKDVAYAIASPLEKEELAVLINLLTKQHTKKK